MRRIALIVPTVAVAGLALVAGCSGGGGSCLSGEWEPADASDWGADAIEEQGGTFDFTLKFDGGDINVNMSGRTEEETREIAAQGKYSVSGDKIKITDMTGSAKVDGEERQDEADDLVEGLEGAFEYSCSGDTLTFDGEEFTRR
ncbi:MAG: hypothetical protein LBU50_07540 [Cellulomonas sp.]|jgi:hypothetical protein|nr:hypothetical protein [Cellulomonas sp.]